MKPIDTFTITLDHDPDKFLCISDKNRKDLDKLVNGSVWRVDGQDYSYDEQINWYVLRRIDNVV